MRLISCWRRFGVGYRARCGCSFAALPVASVRAHSAGGSILGAINPLTQELIRGCNQTYINSHTVCELLPKIAALKLAALTTLMLDNAAPGTRKRRLATLPIGPNIGPAIEHRVAVSRVVLAEPESDRTALEVREKASLAFATPHELRRLPSRDRHLPRRVNHNPKIRRRFLSHSQLPNIRKRVNAFRVRYHWSSARRRPCETPVMQPA